MRRAVADEQALTVGLNEFLDMFYVDMDPQSRARRIADEPVLTGDPVDDAFVGGVGEHLARRWKLGQPPDWTERAGRFLKRAWFPPGVEAEKAFLIAESPLAFRRRMIFVSAEPLRRARMPRDERWYAYEEARTGFDLRPDAGAQAPASSS